MMATISNLLVASFIIFSLFHGNAYSNSHDDKKVYIVYMGSKPHDDHNLIAQSHYDALAKVLGSEEEAKKAMVYTYKYSFSGFAAELTNPQAKQIAEIPGVIKVMQDKQNSLPVNTRSWDYLGLSYHSPNNLLHKSNLGDGIIIGIIDSGIYPSRAFNDKDHGPIPSKWKGICKSHGKFNASEICNKKVIGARYFNEGFLRAYADQNLTFKEEPSPLDDSANGHGTHVASTAAGSFVDNAKYNDFNFGTFRGGAPLAKLAIYKACWMGGMCVASDLLSAYDHAINDGVDLISYSIGPDIPLTSEIDMVSGGAIGSFHAVMRGIPVVFAGGNAGPNSMTVGNISPWATTVAASNIDRSLSILLTVGGQNRTIVGEGVFSGKEIDFTRYVMVTKLFKKGVDNTTEMIPDDGSVKGKILVALANDAGCCKILANRTAELGGVALVLAAPPNDIFVCQYNDRTSDKKSNVPVVRISYADGNSLFDAFLENPDRDTLKISTTRVHLGNPIFRTKVAKFSSRGPNARVPSILKPDISAPGVNILGAASGDEKGEFTSMSGTSMAAPHVAGVIALLRKAHPDWSPSALKSAITTTAWNHDSSGFPIYTEGSSLQLANPFDFGGGVINPNAATNPGLVYDMETTDYVHYLCALGYDKNKILNVTKFGETDNGFSLANICPNRKLSIFNVNVPSITIADLRKSVKLIRTVTNVGPVNSTYTAIIQAPVGTKISVKPRVLKFNSARTKISFIVDIISTQESIFFNFGSLTWTDGKHNVRIPVSVKSEFSP